jgi:hypothetical protein
MREPGHAPIYPRREPQTAFSTPVRDISSTAVTRHIAAWCPTRSSTPRPRARLRDDRRATQPRSADDLQNPSNWAGVAITARTQGSLADTGLLPQPVRRGNPLKARLRLAHTDTPPAHQGSSAGASIGGLEMCDARTERAAPSDREPTADPPGPPRRSVAKRPAGRLVMWPAPGRPRPVHAGPRLRSTRKTCPVGGFRRSAAMQVVRGPGAILGT